MQIKNLLVMSSIILCGLPLSSCGSSTKANVGIGHAVTFSGGSNSEIELTAAMVAFDHDGRIVDARIDAVEVKMEVIDQTIKVKGLTSDGEMKTKLELGKDYGMVDSGMSKAEIDTQIEAFASWSVGKTIPEIKSYTEEKVSNGQKTLYLKNNTISNCSVSVGDFIAAMENAYTLKSTSTYSLNQTKAGVSLITNVKSQEISIALCGVIANGEKVAAASMDETVFNLKLKDGEIALDETSPHYDALKVTKSKKDLHDDYGMADKNNGYGESTLEWYEQAAVIEAGVVGKTANEILSLQKGKDPIAQATIEVSNYVKGIAKALKYASMQPIGPQGS